MTERNQDYVYDARWKLKFVRSEFRGQLPAEYATGPDGTKIIPDNMNDMNREEESRYVREDNSSTAGEIEMPFSPLDGLV